MKPLHLLLILLLLVAITAGAALLLHEDGDDGSGDVVTVEADESGAGRAPELTVVAPEAGRVESLTAAPAPPPATEVGEAAVPASYRAALGGLVGRVVEEDGSPVADIPVSLMGGGAADFLPALDTLARTGEVRVDPELAATRTDAEGRFRFVELETRVLGALMVDPGGPRTLLHLLEQTPVSGEERDLGDIVLPAGVTLLGRVLDERGEPLPLVRVRATDLQPIMLQSGVADFRMGGGVLVDEDEIQLTVVPPPSLARLEQLLPFPTTVTDSEGRFELPGVRPGLVSVVLDDNVHLTVVEGPTPTGEAGGTLDLGDLTMPDGLTQRGRVVDADDEPVAGAEVMVGNQLIFGPVAILRPPVRTDAEGRFAVTGLGQGSARAVARRDPNQPFAADTGAGVPGSREVLVRLPARHTLTLTLEDQDGELVDGVQVLARHLPAPQATEIPDWVLPPAQAGAVERDEQGRYLVPDLAPGHWDVTLAAEGHGVVRRTFDLTLADLTETVVLERARALTLRLRDQDGEPVEYALATARSVDREGGMGGDMPVPVTSARSDREGRAELRGLRSGDFALEVVHPAYAVTKLGVSVGEDSISSENAPVIEEDGRWVVEVPLLAGGSIAGTVIDNGAPPSQVLMVTLTPEDQDEIVNAALPRMTLLAPDGSFRFDNVQPGGVDVQVRQRVQLSDLMSWWEPFAMTPEARGEAWVEAGKETEMVLEVGSAYADMDTGFVSGRLTVNGYPAVGWKVRTWGKIRRSTTTDEQGGFTMGQLAAGDVVLMFNSDTGSMTMEGVIDTYSFELPVNGREYVEIALATGSVEGRVRSGRTGLPLAGAEVRLQAEETKRRGWWGGRGGGTVTDADGRFSFPVVAEGSYVIQASAEDHARTRSEAFEVRSLQTLRNVEVSLFQAVTVKGSVVFEGLEEEPGWIFLNAVSESGSEANARVDKETGRFSFDDMAPGQRWTFNCWTNLGGDFESPDHYIGGPEENLVLTFKVKPEEALEEDAASTLELVEEG